MNMKVCTGCNEELPATREWFGRGAKHGLRKNCHACYRQLFQYDRERFTKYQKSYRANKESNRIAQSRRRARKQSLPGTFTVAEWHHCLEYFHHVCAVCGNQFLDLFGKSEVHQDHWIPISYEGDDNPGTVAGNMICLCNGCNLSKSATLPDEWLGRHYSKRKAKQIITRISEYFMSLN